MFTKLMLTKDDEQEGTQNGALWYTDIDVLNAGFLSILDNVQ